MRTKTIFITGFTLSFVCIAGMIQADQESVDIRSNAVVNGNLQTDAYGTAHLSNVMIKGSTVRGDMSVNQSSVVNGDVVVGSEATLEHGSVSIDDSRVMGDLSVKTRARSGDIVVKEDGYANIGSMTVSDSVIGSGRFDLSANTGRVQVDEGGQAYISGVDVRDTYMGGASRIRTKTNIGDVHVHKDGSLNVGSLKLRGASVHSINKNVRLDLPEGINVDSGTSVEVGAIEVE